MRRELLLITVLVIFVVCMSKLAFNIQLVEAEPTTIIVPDDHEKIRWAINNATDGDTVFVREGIYYELVVIDKAISLKGESRDSTIIDGKGGGSAGSCVIRVDSNFVEISELTVENRSVGIFLVGYGATMRNVCIRNTTDHGLWLYGGSNTICDNVFEFNSISIYGRGPSNLIRGNIFRQNTAYAIYSFGGDNHIYHNNFCPGDGGAHTFDYIPKWDNGAEGNYWSDYAGEDLNGDGIGDTLTPHRGIDNYPLMEPWDQLRRFEVIVDGTTHNVTTFSESTIASFHFNQPDESLRFNITSAEAGFCNVTIPKAMYNNTFMVAIDNVQSDFVSQQNATHSFVWFAHNPGTHRVQMKCVTTTTSTLSFSVNTATPFIGFKVEIDGRLTLANGTGIPSARIALSYSTTDGDSWADFAAVTTGPSGNFSVQWIPSATGVYNVRAIYLGNETRLMYILGAIATINLAVLPFEEQSVFSVTSNSTVSELTFNSSSRELGFTVTGPSNTTGYVKVHIAKTLVESVADLKVYLNGAQLNYTATSIDDSWLLYFIYSHSTHKVTIGLGFISIPFVETPLGSAVIYGVPVAIVIILTSVIVLKRTYRRTLP